MSLRHLLDIRSLTREQLLSLLNDSKKFVEVSRRSIKKVPALRGKTVINLFLEASTRTRASFEIAGKRLSADTINLTASGSSVQKGEGLIDTAKTLEAMAPDILVIRHPASGAPHILAERIPKTSIVNAGDGMHEHPTQALLDCLSLMERLNRTAEELSGLTVAIVGDIRHSRVARSNMWAHRLLGNSVRLVGPSTLVPDEFAGSQYFPGGVTIHHDLAEGIEGADVVMVLRMQMERQHESFVPSLDEYSRYYGLSVAKLERFAPDAVVLHPGPANRGIEINGALLYDKRSLVSQQVEFGVAVRMAVLFSLATGKGALPVEPQSVEGHTQ
ncbi:MAG: aspartate carbamoyltransferase catalytic subunit [Bdellovibrionales bacterium]|nr:aspartate carbamoyltransferase catalytic subunit [Bdellovibrionales bacterium]